MTTYLQLQQAIADDLDRDDLTTQIQKAINRAIYYYQAEPGGFFFQQTTGTFSLVVGQNSYAVADGIPSDLGEINYMQITSNGFDYEVRKRTIDWIQNQDPTNFNGDPTDYAYYQEKIWFSPTPDTVRTITVYYNKYYSALSADADTNDFTTNPIAEELIRARAEWLLHIQLLHGEEETATSKALELDALNQLRAQTQNYQKGLKTIQFE